MIISRIITTHLMHGLIVQEPIVELRYVMCHFHIGQYSS